MARVLIIVPTFNERESVEVLLPQLFALSEHIDVLVVDDNSPDGTAEVVRKKQKEYGEDRLQLLVRTQGKAGRGSACLAGFTRALEKNYHCAIEMDADLSHDPKDIPRFLEAIRSADIVIGSKHMKGGKAVGTGWHRVLFSAFANFYARLILQVPITDYTSGYRCYSRRALEAIPSLKIDGTGFTVLHQTAFKFHKLGMTFKEIPIIFINRRYGKSTITLWEVLESFFLILKIRSHVLALHIFQTFKFGVTGVINTFVDLGFLAAFVEIMGLPLRVSVFIASGIAMTNAFLMHKYWTFQNGEKEHLRQYVQFLLVYSSSFFLGIGITLGLTEWLGVFYILSRLVAIPICALWNYLWMHFGVFQDTSKSGR